MSRFDRIVQRKDIDRDRKRKTWGRKHQTENARMSQSHVHTAKVANGVSQTGARRKAS